MSGKRPLYYIAETEEEYDRMLLDKMIEEANRKDYNLNHNSRGFAYNAGPKELIKFLQIGSSAA